MYSPLLSIIKLVQLHLETKIVLKLERNHHSVWHNHEISVYVNMFFLYLQSNIRSNLQYASLSALRRLPLDPGNPAFLHRAIQGSVFQTLMNVFHILNTMILLLPNFL